MVFRSKSLKRDPGIQIQAMKKYFPEFSRSGTKGKYTFRGHLRPRKESPSYKVRISYSEGRRPKVFVEAPELDAAAPHRYPDGSLCLFHPTIFQWSDGKHLIAKTIVPWTATWLYFYEVWQKLGVWLGPEAPHTGPKRP